MERRWGNRVVVDEPVRVDRNSGHSDEARLHEVSLSGGFVEGTLEVQPMMRVWLKLPRPERARVSAANQVIEAFVVRKSRNGFGLEWCDFAPPAITNLMVIHQSRAPLALEQADVKRPRVT